MAVWSKIGKATSQLSLLNIDNFPSEWAIFNTRESDWPSQLNLKSLELGLTTIGEAFPISLIDVSSEALRYLATFAELPLRDLADLSPYQQLHELKITCTCATAKPDDAIELPDLPLHLPRLHTLTLAMDYFILAQMRFEFPSLELLIIRVWNTHGKLPALSPRHIRLIFNLPRLIRNPNQALHDSLSLSSALQSFTVCGVQEAQVMKAVTQCKEEGKAVLLTQVIFEERKKDVRIIQV